MWCFSGLQTPGILIFQVEMAEIDQGHETALSDNIAHGGQCFIPIMLYGELSSRLFI